MKIKTKLYRMYETVSLNNIDTYAVEIRGKMIHYETPDIYDEDNNIPIGPGENEDRFYIYEKNKAYFMYIPELKLNYKIYIAPLSYAPGDDDLLIANETYYCHLNKWEALKLNWFHKKTWIQKTENIKWLISIPISIFVAYITTKFTIK